MSRFTFLSGVGVAALSGALAAMPAYASTGEATATATASTPEAADTSASERIHEAIERIEKRREWFAEMRDREAEPALQPKPLSTVGAIAAPAAPAITIDSFAGLRTESFDVASFDPVRYNGGGLVGNINDGTAEIIARDDLGVDGIVDTENAWPSVVQMFFQNNNSGFVGLNCTGTVINPRTVLTAAHCVNSSSSESYGLIGEADQAILIASGVDTAPRIFGTLFDGLSYSEGGAATSTDVIIHSSANLDTDGSLAFPWADVALIAVDEPITDVPALPILLSPLGELTHVVALGYGTNGTGQQGAINTGSPFLRRVGENMLGLIGSSADFVDGVFPALAPTSEAFGFATQTYYWFDFDNPERTQEQKDACVFSGTGINCLDADAVLAIDYFDGDALDGEVATAPGDSGSPLIVDELYDFPVISAVLSGGFDFFNNNNRYGDVSFYNPLYPFFEFITENTPYKYVSAVEGDGVWSDPTRWTQELDPGFFIDDGNGNLVNGIPDGEEPGVYANEIKIGTVLGEDISGNTPETSASLPPQGTPGFGADIPESSVLLGPGSTGFVPQNTDGSPGEAFVNPAQYFEVILNRAGTTTVDLDVEIDRLVIDSDDAGFILPEAWDFTSNIGVEQMAGFAQIDGTLNTPIYTLGTGLLAGDGTIDVDALFNVAGLVSAGGLDSVGTLTVDGDYVQTSGAALVSDFTYSRRRQITSDTLEVTGTAVLDGALFVVADNPRVRFGAEFTVLEAGEIDGEFAVTTLVSRSPVLTAESRVEDGQVIVTLGARRISDFFDEEDSLASLANTLDTLRFSDDFAAVADMFALIDSASAETLGATLSSLTPTSAFAQSFTANGFSQRFTGQVAQRTLALRGGSRGAGAFSAAGNASFALAGGLPAETGRLGVFGSASGIYRNAEQQSGVLGSGSLGFGMNQGAVANGVASQAIGANALEQAALTQAGELTIGADLRVSDAFSFGVAVSDILNSQAATGPLAVQDNRSRAVAIYATYSDGPAFADGYAGSSRQEFGLERASAGNMQAGFSNAIGNAEGRQVFGGMRVGYAFDLAKGVEVGPVASLDYVRNEIGGYDEAGAGRFGLLVDDRTFTSLGAKVGAMASLDIRTGETSAIRAFGSLAYARELADSADVVTARFASAPDTPFTIANALDPQWVSVNAGAEFALWANLQASVSVTSDMGRGVLSNDQGQVALSWQF